MTTPAIFPTLNPGYSFTRRPIAGRTGTAVAASGREVRASYWTYPMWEWDLTHEFLPDAATVGTGAGVTASDMKDLVGFFLSVHGSGTGFLFQDPDENAVVLQAIGTGDGSTVTFTLVKTFGLGSFIVTEPIGYLNQSVTPNVYVDGVLKTVTTDYTIPVTTPGAQTITFTSAPANGKAITMNMSFYYYVKFKDDTLDFEKLMDKWWTQRKLTLASLRG